MEELQLRDYFACRVISDVLKAETDNFKMINDRCDINVLLANSAKTAYNLADAMICVRKLNLK